MTDCIAERTEISSDIIDDLIAHAQRVVRQVCNAADYQKFQDVVLSIGSLNEVKRDEALSKGPNAVCQAFGLNRNLANVVIEMFGQGVSPTLRELSNTLQPVQLFRTIPGIGPSLATRLVDNVKVETMEELWLAIQLNEINRPDLKERHLRTIEALVGR